MVTKLRACLAALVIAVSLVAVPQAAAAGLVREAACQGEYQGDSRLGPATLPRPWEEPVGPLLSGYRRTGDLSTAQFLARYWDAGANNGQGSWIYPPDDGFLSVDGHVLRWVGTLEVGDRLDRFGSEFGSFLAPAGALYMQRSLPPQSLITFDAAYLCNYHRYQVIKEFKVFEGIVAGWFAQPGLGVQVKLDRGLVSGEGRISVAWLLTNGYLVRL